ncbi:MAG: hypothetical protein ACKPKO_34420, partial [Candidatus Fonsibacter sp.]
KIEDNKPLQINYNTFYSQIQTITGQSDVSVNVSRSVSRLKSVFVSLMKSIGGTSRSDAPGMKPWNDFSAQHIQIIAMQLLSLLNIPLMESSNFTCK